MKGQKAHFECVRDVSVCPGEIRGNLLDRSRSMLVDLIGDHIPVHRLPRTLRIFWVIGFTWGALWDSMVVDGSQVSYRISLRTAVDVASVIA